MGALHHLYKAGRMPFIGSSDSGQTLVEYGMIVTLLAMAAFAILAIVGQDVVGLFTSVSSSFTDARTP